MAEGLRAHSRALFDAGWTLLVLSRPLVLAYTLATALFCILARWYAPGPVMDWIVLAALVIVALHGAYFGLGILLLGITTGRLKLPAGHAARRGQPDVDLHPRIARSRRTALEQDSPLIMSTKTDRRQVEGGSCHCHQFLRRSRETDRRASQTP